MTGPVSTPSSTKWMVQPAILTPAVERLALRVHAREGGEQGRVDVDDPLREGGEEVLAEHAHEAGQHDQVDLVRPQRAHERAIEAGPRRVVAVVDHEGGQARGARARQGRALGDVGPDDGEARRAELAPPAAIDERLQVGAAAGDQDADVHRGANSTGASGASAGATSPTANTRSPAPSSSATASARPLGRDADEHADPHVEGAQHLVVGDVAAAREQAEDGRHLPAAEADAELEPGVGRQHARRVVDQAAAGDVGGPAQQVRLVRGHAAART